MTAPRPDSRARRVTVGLAALAVGLVAYLAVAHHELAWEEWHLLRLQSDEKAKRHAALEALVKMRSSRAVAPLLAAAVAGLRDRVPGLFLPDSFICVAQVLRSKGDSIKELRWPAKEAEQWAEYCILSIEKIGAAAVPVLRRRLSSKSRIERAWAAYLLGRQAWAASVLGKLGHETRDAARDLLRLFEDPSEPVREQAVNGFAHIARADSALLKDCVAMVADERHATLVRTSCISALGVGFLAQREAQRGVGDDQLETQISRLTLPAFEAASASRDPAIRLAAMEWTLICFAGERSPDNSVELSPEARKALRRGLEDSDAGVRLRAVETACLADSIAKEAGEALLRRVADPSGPVREAAWRGLDDLARQSLGPLVAADREGPTDRRDTEALLDLLKSSDVKARRAASVSLGYRTADAIQVGPALLLALDDADAGVQAEALISLSGFGGIETSVFLRKAAELLRSSKHVEVRRAAVRVITEAGQTAREALPEIREAAATDADGTVRELARRLAAGLAEER